MDPVLFLDFDRTLFDTDQFYDFLGADRFERMLKLISGELEHPDYSKFLYPDTLTFLSVAKRTHRLVLLTYSVNTKLQRQKIRGSGIVPLLDDVLIAQGGVGEETGKGDMARDYLARVGDFGWEHTFVDDNPKNIDEVKRKNPDIRVIRIDRVPLAQGALSDGLLPPDHVVANLDELIDVL